MPQANSDSFTFLWLVTSLVPVTSVLRLSLNVPIFNSGMRGAGPNRLKLPWSNHKPNWRMIQNRKTAIYSAETTGQFSIESYRKCQEKPIWPNALNTKPSSFPKVWLPVRQGKLKTNFIRHLNGANRCLDVINAKPNWKPF